MTFHLPCPAMIWTLQQRHRWPWKWSWPLLRSIFVPRHWVGFFPCTLNTFSVGIRRANGKAFTTYSKCIPTKTLLKVVQILFLLFIDNSPVGLTYMRYFPWGILPLFSVKSLLWIRLSCFVIFPYGPFLWWESPQNYALKILEGSSLEKLGVTIIQGNIHVQDGALHF